MRLPLAQAGAGEGRTGGARSHGIAPTLPRPRWGRELPVPDGVRWRRLVLVRSAPEARARMVSPPPWPAPAGGGNYRCRMRLPPVQAGAGEECTGGVRSQGIAPTLARPRWGRELPVPDVAPAGVSWCR